MRKINILLHLLLCTSMVLTACNDNDPFSTISPDDDPRILSPSFPDREGNQLPVIMNVRRDKNLFMTVTATPTDYIQTQWFLDEKEVCKGQTIDMPLPAGDYVLKIVVSTLMNKSTSREGIIIVTPLEEDPQVQRIGAEYIVATGLNARIYGKNLEQVASIKIDDLPSSEVRFFENEGQPYIEYKVPADLTEGSHRLFFQDITNNIYGGGRILTTAETLVTSGADHATPSQQCTLNGLNLNSVNSVIIADKTVTEFTEQTPYRISFICPTLPEGNYTISGTTNDDKQVKFLNGEDFENTHSINIQPAALWSGHHYVSWEYEDGNPNKTFNLIPPEVITALPAGTQLAIDYSIEPTAAYHKMQTTTGHWTDLPGTQAFDFSENGRHIITLSQEAIDLMKQQAGFLCVGHGYYVDQITIL